MQEKGAADLGTARVSLQIRTRQIENAKWGEELIARREKGRDERGSAKGESETGKEEKTKRERGLVKDRVAQAPRD